MKCLVGVFLSFYVGIFIPWILKGENGDKKKEWKDWCKRLRLIKEVERFLISPEIHTSWLLVNSWPNVFNIWDCPNLSICEFYAAQNYWLVNFGFRDDLSGNIVVRLLAPELLSLFYPPVRFCSRFYCCCSFIIYVCSKSSFISNYYFRTAIWSWIASSKSTTAVSSFIGNRNKG